MLPALLRSLELKGTLTSIDAMAGHPAIAQQIHEAGGNWLLALKANEKATFDTVAARFRQLSGQQDTFLRMFRPRRPFTHRMLLHSTGLNPVGFPPLRSATGGGSNSGRWSSSR